MSGGTNNAFSSDDFVSPADIRDQLKQLAEHVAERRKENLAYHLPLPSGWRISVLMLTVPEKTRGGVQIVDENREARSMGSPQGVILAIGPGAYRDPARFSVDGELSPWHKVGDRIQFVKYDAQPFKLPNGQTLGILTDTQPVALLDSGWEVPA
jgi:co-chaperonin GroES (HSP10)